MLSRVGDALYWMSRYLERAEHTARAIDVQLHLALDESPVGATTGWVCLLGALKADLPLHLCADDRAMTEALTFDRANPSSIVNCIEMARENARQIREQITSDVWEELNRLRIEVREMDIERMWQRGPHGFLRSIQRGSQLLAGVADSTMNNGEGWQFIRLGRFIERAIDLAWLLDAHFGVRGIELPDEPSPDDFTIWSGLLRTCTAFEPYCKVHTAELRPSWIAQFLLLSADFPHSVRYCAGQINTAVSAIAEWTGTPQTADVRRAAGRLEAELAYRTIDEVLNDDLSDYLQSLVARCFQVHDAVYTQYVAYEIEAALRGGKAAMAMAQ